MGPNAEDKHYLSQAPMLFVSGYIIKKIGFVSCLYLALGCYALRLFVYSIVGNPWLVLLVEPLHSVTFGLMYAAASAYASVIAPAGMSATLQGLIGGLHFGIGRNLLDYLIGLVLKMSLFFK